AGYMGATALTDLCNQYENACKTEESIYGLHAFLNPTFTQFSCYVGLTHVSPTYPTQLKTSDYQAQLVRKISFSFFHTRYNKIFAQKG
ncbi:MAG: hypothetical protein ABL919_15350, partial [Methylococcales bacterium]